ncbi:GNAT family N-acetyltransferase [Seongchinamella sediminis]|uniref:GNAT family N-acetyltransferase n=1 Tax=Seongchinamella sediminis TaxID=2283635 RepID=A0A3L7E400_9GAMM|nr:GNAT family N-acetyltransferase [Seongchinamella sediminis]RLQ23550.1 GNAT family N-acetyltransferase [Seongchinamella sediminis]
MTSLAIRNGTPEDIGQIYHFIRELATYEKALDEVSSDETMLREALFGTNPRAYSLICEVDGGPAGFAIYFYNFSTWLGKYGLFLEDLYVSPEYRGHGAGKALLQHLARQAVAEGCGRFEWNVLDWNEPSIRFYEACGAEPLKEWVGYRLHGTALERFAAG